MYRKMSSNKAYRSTIWQALYNSWKHHIHRLSPRIITLLKNYPRAIYTAMVTSILISLVCFFYLPKNFKDSAKQSSPSLLSSVSSGISSIALSAGAAKELLELQSIIENVYSKDSLTNQDSIMVLYVLERMQKIQSNISNTKMPNTLNSR